MRTTESLCLLSLRRAWFLFAGLWLLLLAGAPASAEADTRFRLLVPLAAVQHGLGAGLTIGFPLAYAHQVDLLREDYPTDLAPLDSALDRARSVFFIEAGIGGARTAYAFASLGAAAAAESLEDHYRTLGASYLGTALFDLGLGIVGIVEGVRYASDRRASSVDRDTIAWLASAQPGTLHGVVGGGMAAISSLEFILAGLLLRLANVTTAGGPHHMPKVVVAPRGLGVGVHGVF